MNYIGGFPYIEPSLHPWDEVYLIMVNYSSDAFLDSIGQDLFNIFASMFTRDIGLKFSFLVWSLFGLGISMIVAS